MSRQLRRRHRRTQRNRHRRLHVESLESRIVLSYCAGAPLGAPDDVFGSLAGTIPSAGATESCDLETTGYTLASGATRIGFHVIGTGGFDPATVQIAGGSATTIYQNANSGGGAESVILAELGAATYTLTVGGEGGTTGNFEMHIFLAGDVDGSRAVDASDRGPLLATYRKTSGMPGFNAAADANRDGMVSGFDYTQWRRNLGDVANNAPTFTSSPGTAATQGVTYTYNVTASDPDPGGDVLTITDPTLPVWLNLTDHGDGTATLTGTPGAGDVGANAVGLLVTDSVGATDTQNFSITVAPAGTPPVATNDVVNSGATGNVQMSSNGAGVEINTVVGGNILDNDTGGSLTATAGTTASTQGGTVTMSSNGDFTYNPPAGYEGVDTFTYTVNNGLGNDVGTVSITVDDMIWFIDQTAPGGGDGRLTSPFNCLVGGGCFDPTAADEAGDNVFLADGSYAAGLTLLNNQKLIGDGASGTLESATGITLAPGSAALPVFSGTDPVLTTVAGDGITLGSGNTIRGLTVGNTAGVGIAGSNFGTLTVSETTISGNGQAIDLDTGALSVSFDSISSAGGANGIDINSVTGSFAVSTTTTVSGATGDGIVISNSGGQSFDFGQTNVGSAGDGIDIATNNSGATFTFDSLSVTNTGGTGLLANNSGTVNINATNASIDSTGGPALDITNTIGQTNSANGWTFGSVTSLNSGTDGVVFASVGQNINLSNIDIDNAAHEGIELNGVTAGTNTITGGSIDGALTDRHGIFLTGVTGTTIIQGQNAGSKFDITNIGTGAGLGHSGIRSEGSGNLTVQFVNIDDIGQSGDEHGVSIVDPLSGARTVLIADNRFANIGDTGSVGAGSAIDVEVTFSATFSGVLDIDVTYNDINGNGTDFTTTGIAVNLDFAAPANGALNANISSNDIDGVVEGIAILVHDAAGSGVNGRNEIQINDNTGDDFDNNGIELDVTDDDIGAGGSNTRAVISGNNLTAINAFTGDGHNPDQAIEVEARGGSLLTLSVDITNNIIDGAADAQGERWDDSGITVGSAGSVGFNGMLSFDIENNTISHVEDEGIVVQADESATVNARVTNNTVASTVGDGFESEFESSDPATLNLLLQGNTMSTGGTEYDVETRVGPTLNLECDAGCPVGLGSTSGLSNLVGVLAHNGNNATLANTTNPGGAAYNVVASGSTPGANLLAVGGQTSANVAISLNQAELDRAANAAIDFWAAAGISAAQHETLQQVQFEVFNLPAGHLGNSLPGIVEIDLDAAGRGWSLDPVVGDSRVDLLTVVMHELGHVLGLGDTDHGGHDLMSGSLDTGLRRSPGASDLRFAPGMLFEDSRFERSATEVSADSHLTDVEGRDDDSPLTSGRLDVVGRRELSGGVLSGRRVSKHDTQQREDEDPAVDDTSDWLDQLAMNLAMMPR